MEEHLEVGVLVRVSEEVEEVEGVEVEWGGCSSSRTLSSSSSSTNPHPCSPRKKRP